jgi:TRAP-type C4-dicarboxylate transport system substrate-binding protein
MDLTLRQLNAVPVRVAPPEIYESMSRGTLDGALLSYQSVTSYHLPALLKSGTLGQDFGTVAVTFAIATATLNALPENVRQTLIDAGRWISETACKPFDRTEDASIATVRAAKVRLVEPVDSDKAQLATAFEQVRAEWARRLDARGKSGTATLKAFMDAASAAKPE